MKLKNSLTLLALAVTTGAFIANKRLKLVDKVEYKAMKKLYNRQVEQEHIPFTEKFGDGVHWKGGKKKPAPGESETPKPVKPNKQSSCFVSHYPPPMR